MSQYTTITEAQTYFDGRLNTEAWDDADKTKRDKSLKHATSLIERLNFTGDKADEDQVLQFPRGDDTTVPTDIQYACAELAMALLDGVDPDLELENLGMVSQGIASIRSTYDVSRPSEHILAGIPSASAWRFLKPYLRDPLTVNLDRVG